jgi:tRNA-modifying protein YgfZ
MFYQLQYDTVHVSGSDATVFLQGQMTANIETIDTNKAQLSACCEANGRMVASMIINKIETGFLLFLPRGMGQILIDHLQKYAVFSKVNLLLENIPCYGSMDEAPIDDKTLRLPGKDPRYLSWSDQAAQDASLDNNDFELANIKAHFALIPTILTGKLIPSMLHYDTMDGVSFDKGCYVGQEIIARLHYRGQLKRHLHHITTSEALSPGESIVNEDKKSVGVIISTAKKDQVWHALAVIEDRALDNTLYTSTHAVIKRIN